MKRRHYITSFVVLVLPVIVIYALTSYGIQEPPLEQPQKMEKAQKIESSCQKKQLPAKEGEGTT